MPANPRPTDAITPDNLLIGMPYIEFAPRINGVLQPFQSMGIVDSAALAKELEQISLESSQSGSRTTVRDLVTKVTPQFNVGVFNFAASVLRFSLASATLTEVSANTAQAVSAESVLLTADQLDFLDLRNRLVNVGSVSVAPAAVAGELLGTGDGTKGAVSGDYKLAYKVRLPADVTGTIDVNNGGVVTSYTPVAVGGAGVGNKVEVVVGTGSDSGNLRFFVGAGAVNLTGTITASYTPSFPLVEGVGRGVAGAVGAAQSDDGGVFTNETTDANSAAAADVTLTPAVPVVNDAFYVGLATVFDRARFVISTAGVGTTVIWEYHNGTTWVALANVTDKTAGFTAVAGSYDVTWDMPADWRQLTVNAIGPLYWVRGRVSAVAAPTGAVGTQVFVSLLDDYELDTKGGRLKVRHDDDKTTGYSGLITGQSVAVTYTYNRLAHSELQPFTQPSGYLGAARIRQLTDVGVNLIWQIPSAQLLLTDDDLEFADEDFTVGNLSVKLLDDPVERFGTLQVFSETQAGA